MVCNVCNQEGRMFKDCKEKGKRLSYADMVSSTHTLGEGLRRVEREAAKFPPETAVRQPSPESEETA